MKTKYVEINKRKEKKSVMQKTDADDLFKIKEQLIFL